MFWQIFDYILLEKEETISSNYIFVFSLLLGKLICSYSAANKTKFFSVSHTLNCLVFDIF